MVDVPLRVGTWRGSRCGGAKRPTLMLLAARAVRKAWDAQACEPSTVGFHAASFDAIGVRNTVVVSDEAALPRALELVRAAVAQLDDVCSRFRGDSELVRLNEAGGGIVSPLLFAAIDTALRAAERTDGIVDPTVGSQVRALGYDRDFQLVLRRGPAPVLERRPASGWRSVDLDRERSGIRLAPGTELDLGATAKAFAADRIARSTHAATSVPVLVSLGGDIAVAGPAPDGGWPVLVTDDSRGLGTAGQVVAIFDGGLATSSTTVRRWRAGGVEVHHIVDPATGAPADETWRTVSVTAATCVAANTASTAAIVLGHSAPAWLAARGLAARLVRPDGAIVRVGGWPVERP